MSVIGVYDSGIGGLFTLAKLSNALPQADFYYLADNLNMPFGLKSESELSLIVDGAIARLYDNADISVLACNTASVTTRHREVFKLMPDLGALPPSDTLVLATPLTMSRLGAKESFFHTADTAELATLIEIQASLLFKQRFPIEMNALYRYLDLKLKDMADINTVVVGCSHYIYVKPQLSAILGRHVRLIDGNDTLVKKVTSFGSFTGGSGKITFAFTGADESKKYRYILEKIRNDE